MNMQQFTGWVTRLLDALPWRRAQRPPKPLMRERVAAPPKYNRFAFPDDYEVRRQTAENTPPCSTLHEDPPTDHEPPTPSQSQRLSAAPPPEPASASLLALPAPPAMGALDAAAPAEPAGEPQPFQADSERRLAFGRYLFRRGVFNEGFPSNLLPTQYRDQTPQD